MVSNGSILISHLQFLPPAPWTLNEKESTSASCLWLKFRGKAWKLFLVSEYVAGCGPKHTVDFSGSLERSAGCSRGPRFQNISRTCPHNPAGTFRVEPRIVLHEPILDRMLATADAALIIGDSALRITPEELPFECLDLGTEWLAETGLPMVFAVWAGKPGIPVESLQRITNGSYEFGKTRIDEIVEQEYRPAESVKNWRTGICASIFVLSLGQTSTRDCSVF